MSYKRAFLLTALLVLGISLLLNPVYLAPGNLDGTANTVTYEVSQVESDVEARQVLYQYDGTLQCGGSAERPCALERAVADQGQLEFDGSFAEDADDRARQPTHYDLVQLDDGFYIPETEPRENTTLLTHRNVSTTEALEYVSIPDTETSSAVRRAIEAGNVTLVEGQLPVLERGQPIEHAGRIYAVDSVRYDGTVDEELLFTRMVLSFGGFGLVALAWSYRGDE